MLRVVLMVACVCVALLAAVILRRRTPDVPTQANFEVPSQINRADFDSPSSPWLIVIFTSATCGTCDDVATKAQVLSSADVAVVRVDYTLNKALHERYKIAAVPTLVMADNQGIVHKSFLGPVKAQDMWAAMAECRDPGSTPESCAHHAHD